MQRGIVMTEDQEDAKKTTLNNDKSLEINRGVELLLRNRRKRTPRPKTFQVKFGNMFSFLRREIHFYFEFHLDIRKK